MTESVASEVTGDDIISELIRNADEVRYTILVPCIFNVYLHPQDYWYWPRAVDQQIDHRKA